MTDQTDPLRSLHTLSQPLTLPCGLTLPNRLVKCPMQETLAHAPLFDPPVTTFKNLYTKWGTSKYGLLITGQVQIDIRFLSVPGDVVVHAQSGEGEHFEAWKEWARISKQDGTPCIVQLAHPGRMSRKGAGIRPDDMQTLCPSEVPVAIGDSWADKLVSSKVLGTPKAMTLDDIEEVVDLFKHAARVVHRAGFDGLQLHGAHGFLLSQFLSPHTNRRTDDYGGSPDKRMRLLRRLVEEIRAEHPAPFCLSVKLNSADYMEAGVGLQTDEGLGQVKWLIECGMVDFVEISGGNAEQKTCGLRTSFGKKSMEKAPPRAESTRIREAFFTDFAEKVMALDNKHKVPIQLSGGFRSRNGMADAIESGVCDLIGLGRASVLQPELPREVILNSAIPDDDALAVSHQLKGLWISKWFPVKVIGAGFGIQYFYYNMRRLGHGFNSDLHISIPNVLLANVVETLRAGLSTTFWRVMQSFGSYRVVQKTD